MSDQPRDTEDQTEAPQGGASLGHTTRTDVGGTTGTQPDATVRGSGATAARPAEDLLDNAQRENDRGGSDEIKAGDALGDDAPALADLQFQPCPNCGTGVLYVVRYDPNALHELAQRDSLPRGYESGGGYQVHCFQCAYSDSRAFNPGPLWGSERAG